MKIVGIAGLAHSGKDLFYELCAKELKRKEGHACRIAIADELKKECKDAVKSMYGIDPTNCKREDKNKIRDVLVYHGLFRRIETEGQYWTKKADNKIKNLKRNCTINTINNPVCFVTDVRYHEYEKDEVYWIRKKHKGLLVHITKTTGTLINENGTTEKFYEEPVNKHEEENDPKLNEIADVCIEWPSCGGNQEKIDKFLKPVIRDFVKNHLLS